MKSPLLALLGCALVTGCGSGSDGILDTEGRPSAVGSPASGVSAPAAPSTRATHRAAPPSYRVGSWRPAPIHRLDSDFVPVRHWLTGRLEVVPGNDVDQPCLALNTTAGAYTVAASSDDYDATVMFVQVPSPGVDRSQTGIHRHGAPTADMVVRVGERVSLLAEESLGSDAECSAYPSLGFYAVRR